LGLFKQSVCKVTACGLLLLGFGSLSIADGQPNVLLIISDDLNTDLGSYGHKLVRTPYIDALAKKGMQFNAAYSQYPLCAPSRASFLTSTYPEHSGFTTNQHLIRELMPDVVTLPQALMNAGYHTARVGKVFHYGVPNMIGTDGVDDEASWNERHNPSGVDHLPETEARLNHIGAKEYNGKPLNIGASLNWLSLASDDSEHTDYEVASRALSVMAENHPEKTGKPFFLAVGFFRPHLPFIAPENYFDMYPLDQIELTERRDDDRDDIPLAALTDKPYQLEMSDETKRKVMQGYYASISFMDAQVGRVLAGLERLDLEKDTIVIFMSDHGYQLGAHDLWMKNDLFEGSAHSPLIISVPGSKTKGQESNSLVEYVDLYPTITELAGVKTPGAVMGRSLTPVLMDASASVRNSALTQSKSRAFVMHEAEGAEKNVIGISLRTERYRYTIWAEGEKGVELYDYQSDPREFTNLAGKKDYAEIESKMKNKLAQRRAYTKL